MSFHATLDDAAAVDLGEQPMDAEPETTRALRGYREAMTYVLQIAHDEDFEFHEQLLKSPHFMMVGYDLAARPGRWRAGSIFVERSETRDIVYEGAPIDEVPAHTGELIRVLNKSEIGEPIVDAAMAHLNLVDDNALWDAASGYRVRNATYRAQVKPDGEITETTASRDLRLLADLGFLHPVGERRGRHYVAGSPLVDLRHAVRRRTPMRETEDPFRLK